VAFLKRSHTLTEIILSVAAVIFVGVFAVRLYIKAENVQNMARDLDMASLAAQSAVEIFKSRYSHPGTVYFDGDFRVVPEIGKNGFVLTMDIADDGTGFFDVKVDVARVKPYFGETETHVFSLTTAVYKGSGK
jgi:hypothetical protein